MAEFQDRVLKCVDCGADFVFTAGEQHFFHDKNFKNEPKRCKACKTKRQGGGGRGFAKTETMTTCSQCGRETTVPFQTNPGSAGLLPGVLPQPEGLGLVDRGSRIKSTQLPVDLWALSDLCTPWCIHVVVTLRVAEHLASGITRIDESGDRRVRPFRISAPSASAPDRERSVRRARARAHSPSTTLPGLCSIPAFASVSISTASADGWRVPGRPC